MAMGDAAKSDGGSGDAMGAGLGLMLPAMFAQHFSTGQPASQPGSGQSESAVCPDCKKSIPLKAKFCPFCGHQQVVFDQCNQCGKNLPPNAQFCSRCGTAVEKQQKSWFCGQCDAENLADALFCNQCGDKH